MRGPQTPNSPPTQRVLAALEAIAAASDGITASMLARQCDMSTSTCALILAELERNEYIQRDSRRRFILSSGLLNLVHALRSRYPLLDIGRSVLEELHAVTKAPCLLVTIERDALVVADIVGYIANEQHAVGQRFPFDPPFGSVAMAWSDNRMIESWLRQVQPRLSGEEIDRQHAVCAEIRARGFGVFKLHEVQPSLRDKLTALLDSAAVDDSPIPPEQLSRLLTGDSLQSVTADPDCFRNADFVSVPVFASNGQPRHLIEIHFTDASHRSVPSDRLEAAVRNAADRLSDGRPLAR